MKLRSREEIAEHSIAFWFEKLVDWTFKAGQSLDMTQLDSPATSAEGNKRASSIASVPHEDTLMIATRMRNTIFKRTLKSIPRGSGVEIEGPFADLTLHNNTGVDVLFAEELVERRFIAWWSVPRKWKTLGSAGMARIDR